MDNVYEKCSGLKRIDWSDSLKGKPVTSALHITVFCKKYAILDIVEFQNDIHICKMS